MGRTRRNCPLFGCGSTNLARLANHLDQVHGMDTKERAKWLKWSKLGICVSQQREQPEEFNMGKSLEKLLKRQQEMERKFNAYLQAVEVKKDHCSKGEHYVSVPLYLPFEISREISSVERYKALEANASFCLPQTYSVKSLMKLCRGKSI